MRSSENDGVIRNPNRKKADTLQYEEYQPEYSKKGIKPVIRDQSSSNEEEDIGYDDVNISGTPSNEGVGKYTIMYSGEIICSNDSLEYIKNVIFSMHDGDHPDFNRKIPLDDIILVKKMNIRFDLVIE